MTTNTSSFLRRLSLFATVFAFVVVVLGAYTRLTDAGLGCPDWPGCYGLLTVPSTPDSIAAAEAGYDIPVEATKAWTEMVHRYFAGTLGLLIVALFIGAWYKRQERALASTLLVLVCCQAALGMWTVTLKLLPAVVMLHLLGGFTTLTLLWVTYCRLHATMRPPRAPKPLPLLAGIALFILILQLALGGWTSANYAALICPDFPTCQAQWLPRLTLNAFDLTTGAGLENPLIAFGNIERVTIHVMHRIGAICTGLILILLAMKAWHLPNTKKLAIMTLALVLLQISLGIINVVHLLPLSNAVAHNAVGALLLLTVVTLNLRVRGIA